jgi:hypothetical protein
MGTAEKKKMVRLVSTLLLLLAISTVSHGHRRRYVSLSPIAFKQPPSLKIKTFGLKHRRPLQ